MEADRPLAILREQGVEGYVVGGAVRDRMLGRPTDDFDVAVPGEPARIARALGKGADGHAFELSEGFGGWRVVARDRSWQVDVLPLHEGSIAADLAKRDLTVNAMAEPLQGGELVDPFAGRADLEDRRLRMVSDRAFAADPLRVMRLARLACELGFTVEATTTAAARTAAAGLERVAPERVFAELRRVMVGPEAVAGLELLEGLEAMAVVLPELSALRGVVQSHYHHLDVHAHTLAVLAATINLEQGPGGALGEQGRAADARLREPLANDLSRWEAMRFGALFHDIAKPQTRNVTPEGRTTFMGHDVAGAEVATQVLGRLRASQKLCDHVAALARHHLRLGFLVHEAPLSRRAVYRYLHTCEPVGVDVTVLSVADRLATQGTGSAEAIDRHLALAREVLGDALRWEEERPRPPVRGDDLAREIGLRPGPRLGEILAELEQAAYAGEITSREEAVARARALARGDLVADR